MQHEEGTSSFPGTCKKMFCSCVHWGAHKNHAMVSSVLVSFRGVFVCPICMTERPAEETYFCNTEFPHLMCKTCVTSLEKPNVCPQCRGKLLHGLIDILEVAYARQEEVEVFSFLGLFEEGIFAWLPVSECRCDHERERVAYLQDRRILMRRAPMAPPFHRQSVYDFFRGPVRIVNEDEDDVPRTPEGPTTYRPTPPSVPRRQHQHRESIEANSDEDLAPSMTAMGIMRTISESTVPTILFRPLPPGVGNRPTTLNVFESSRQ